jgi:hypothetical protein
MKSPAQPPSLNPFPRPRAKKKPDWKKAEAWNYIFRKYKVPLSAAAGLLIVVLAAAILLRPSKNKNDQLFEEWLRVQLMDVEMWQATAPLNDPRNPETVKCLWQRSVSESDCLLPRNFSYPVSLRLSNGYLLSQGIHFPLETQKRWERVSSIFKGHSSGFGLDENWRPCVGDFCRYEVYTGFIPTCADKSSYCGRADRFKIGYIIKSRRLERQFWQPYEQLISNLDDSRDLQPIEFNPENVFQLPIRACKSDLQVPLSRNGDGSLICGVTKKNLISTCFGNSRDFNLLYRSGFCLPDNCENFCKRAIKALEKPCESSKLEMINRSPDLFRCSGRSRIVFLSKYKNPFENPAAINRSGILSRALKIDFDFCINKSTCFGAFTRKSTAKELEAFLEAK